MSDEKRPRKSADTLHEEITRSSREAAAKAEAEEAQASQWAREALTERAKSAEDAARMWHRLSMGLVVVLTIVIAGLLGVGVSGKIPGVGEIEIDRPGDIERAAPRVELRNEAAELPEVAP